ncbi:MAG: polysaccharide deacetylase family protein, partial [Ilumatobacteraceae bacterium]
MTAMVRLLGTAPVAGVSRLLTRWRLRVVTYHGVTDSAAFAAQLDWLGERFTTVTAGQVADALHGGAALPPRPVWLTFDDGDITVVRNALPILRERGMVATAFLCGAWLDSAQLPWWVTLESAQREGLVQPADTGHTDPSAARLALKRMPDPQRRAVIATLAERLAGSGLTPAWPQWTTADGLAWLAAGNDLGNHSWDHPLLDRCDEAEQRRQVRAAHERLSNTFGHPCDVFA